MNKRIRLKTIIHAIALIFTLSACKILDSSLKNDNSLPFFVFLKDDLLLVSIDKSQTIENHKLIQTTEDRNFYKISDKYQLDTRVEVTLKKADSQEIENIAFKLVKENSPAQSEVKDLVTIDFPKYRDTSTFSSIKSLHEIMIHLPQNDFNTLNNLYNNQFDRNKSTLAHEAVHALNADVINRNLNSLGGKKGFYIMNSKAVAIAYPKTEKPSIAPLVPEELKSLWNGATYFKYVDGTNGNTSKNATDIIDEWVAYTNEIYVELDMAYNGEGNNTKYTKQMTGSVSFMVYALATSLAIEKNEPNYFASEPNYLPLVRLYIERGTQLYSKGISARLDWTDPEGGELKKYIGILMNSNDAKTTELRNFMIRHFGKEWMEKTFQGLYY